MAQVLFIDDDTDALETYKKAVALRDHEAVVASDGNQAWEKLSQFDIRLIIVDLNLPDISGVELIERLSHEETTKSIPVVVLSALPEKELINQVTDAGARMFLSKPVPLHKLLTVIEKYVSP